MQRSITIEAEYHIAKGKEIPALASFRFSLDRRGHLLGQIDLEVVLDFESSSMSNLAVSLGVGRCREPPTLRSGDNFIESNPAWTNFSGLGGDLRPLWELVWSFIDSGWNLFVRSSLSEG